MSTGKDLNVNSQTLFEYDGARKSTMLVFFIKELETINVTVQLGCDLLILIVLYCFQNIGKIIKRRQAWKGWKLQ